MYIGVPASSGTVASESARGSCSGRVVQTCGGDLVRPLLMLALDVLVEAEQLVSSTGAGVVLLVVAVLPIELVYVPMDAGLMFLTIYQLSSKRNDQQLRLAKYGPLVEIPQESNG